jgi:hypothetical protein
MLDSVEWLGKVDYRGQPRSRATVARFLDGAARLTPSRAEPYSRFGPSRA